VSRFTTFLKTTTGIVTALATLVVAITGLVTAMKHLVGTSGASTATSATVERTTSSDTLSSPDLRAAIPAQIRPTCRPSGPTDYPEETAVAAANCRYREVVELQYNLFASDVELRQDLTSVRRRFGDKHECGSKPLFCFVQDSGQASIIWIDEPKRMLGFAWRDDGNLDALYESWNEIAP
jgi:hypothetical protein